MTGVHVRTRNILVAIIILLVLLLFGVMAGFFYLTRAPGVPEQGEQESILVWDRSIYGWGPTLQEQLEDPQDVEFDSAGRIYVTDQIRSQIVVYAASGTFQRFISNIGDGEGQMRRPVAIAFDDQGLMYVADSHLHKILKFHPDGEFIAEWDDAMPLALDVQGDRLYVASGNHVSIFSLDGDIVDQFGIRGYEAGSVDMPHGIAVEEDGSIWVSDAHNVRIQVLSQDGTQLREIGPGRRLPEDDSTASGIGTETPSTETSEIAMQIPTGIAFDDRGNVWLADAFNFTITAFTRDGELIDTYGVFGTDDGDLRYPTGISYDPDRRLLAVADTVNDRIQIFNVVLPGDSLLGNRVRRWALSPLCYGPLGLLILLIVVLGVMSLLRRRSRARDVDAAPFEDES